MIGCFCVVRIQFATAPIPSALIGERPALQEHVNQADIENGATRFNQLLEIGESIFAARWTKLDGQVGLVTLYSVTTVFMFRAIAL